MSRDCMYVVANATALATIKFCEDTASAQGSDTITTHVSI